MKETMPPKDPEELELDILERIKDKGEKATEWEVITRLAYHKGYAELQIRRCLTNFETIGFIKKEDCIYKLTENGQEYLDALIAKRNRPM